MIMIANFIRLYKLICFIYISYHFHFCSTINVLFIQTRLKYYLFQLIKFVVYEFMQEKKILKIQ